MAPILSLVAPEGGPLTRKLESEDVEPSLSLSWQEIILFGLSRRTVGTIVVLSAIVSEAMSVASPDQAQYVANSMNLQLFIGLMAISFAASWIWSSMQAILQYYRLQLRIFPDEIGIVSGLITKRSVEIPTLSDPVAVSHFLYFLSEQTAELQSHRGGWGAPWHRRRYGRAIGRLSDGGGELRP